MTNQVIDTIQEKGHPVTDPKQTIKEIIRDVKKRGSGHFIAIFPGSNELFSFIPIIENEQFFAAQFPDPI